MANDHVVLEGFDEILKQLDSLGAQGDQITRVAATEAATDLRDTFLIRNIGLKTGLSSGVIRKNTKVYGANKRYPGAHLMFSSSGIPVEEFNYTSRTSGIHATRAQVLIDWVTGGQKVAAGFINQYGKRKAPVATRNERTTQDRMSSRLYKLNGKAQYKIDGIKEKKQLTGKNYTYYSGEMKDARGPSLAAAYSDMSKAEVYKEAEARLADRLAYYLEFIFD